MGTVIGIATRKKTKAVMDTHDHATVLFEKGIGNDSRGKKRNNRQITILSKEAWEEACNDLNTELAWTTRRANLFVEGIVLKNTKGKQLKVGNFLLEVTGELEPCNRMDEQFQGLTKALTKEWRGGITCKLLSEGTVEIGDSVEFV